MDNKESSLEEQKRTCTLSNDELVKRCDEWISKLCKSGGRTWCLDQDPDMLFQELIQRFAATFVKAKLTHSEPVRSAEEIYLKHVVHPHDPNDSWQNEGDENVYTETGHPGF